MAGPDDLPVRSFADRAELRAWLSANHATSAGLWVRLARARSRTPSVTFHDLLEEGLCFGWSESKRRSGDGESYLQRFAPRRRTGTVSARNEALAARLVADGLMTPAGLRALGR